MQEKNNKLLWTGLGISLLSLGLFAALAYGPGSDLWAGLLMILAPSIAWGVILRRALSTKADDSQLQRAESYVREQTDKTKGLLVEYEGEFRNQFSHTHNEIDRLQKILSDAIERLIPSFHKMFELSGEQQRLALEIAQGAVAQTSDNAATGLSFEQFIKETTDLLKAFVDSTIENSKSAMGLVQQMDSVKDQVAKTLKVLKEIESISKQTK